MPTITVDGVDVSDKYQKAELDAIALQFAALDAEIGTGTAPVPDAAGTQEPYAGQQFRWSEGAVTVLDGFLAGIVREEGASVATRLLNTHAVWDDNALLRGFRTLGWSRPAETDQARVLAFAAAFLPGTTDTTWVLATNLVTLPAKKYSAGENLTSELLTDLQDYTGGKTLFIEARRLHYHLPTEGITAGLSIDDVAYDFATSFPPEKVKRSKDPLDLRNDVYATNGAGASYTATDATSISRHDAAGLKHQAYLEFAGATAAEVQAKAIGYLATDKDERVIYECTIGPLSAAQVADIPVGSLVTCTSRIWGLTATPMRIAHMTVRYLHPAKYFAELELAWPLRLGLRTGRGNPLNPLGGPPPYGQPLPYVACGPTIDLDGWTRYQGAGSFVGGVLTQIGLDNVGYWTPFPVGATGAIRVHILLDAATTSASLMAFVGTPGSPTDSEWIAVGVNGGQTYFNSTGHSLEYPGWGSVLSMWVEMTTGDGRSVAIWRDTETRGDAYIISYTGSSFTPDGLAVALGLLGGVDATGDALFTLCTSAPPTTGQYVVSVAPVEAADSSRTTFTAPSAYAAHTLMVFVDGIRKAVVETSPAAGTFTLAAAPTTGAEIMLTYTAA